MNRLDGRFAASQIPGGREYQEDDYGLVDHGDPETGGAQAWLLADGMGGHAAGGMASGIVVKAFAETYPRADGPVPDRLRTCLAAANHAIATAVAKRPECEGMGSTVVAAVVSSGGLDWISVGDSPLWLFREGGLRRLNADHSMAPVLADLVATGRMTGEEAATDPRRNALRSAVTGSEISLVDVSSQPVILRERDRVLMASDGLMTLEEKTIERVMNEMRYDSLEEVVGALISGVEEAGRPYQDNTTVLLYAPKTASDAETVSLGPVHARAGPYQKNQVSRRKSILSWTVLYGGLIAFGLLAYWFITEFARQ